MKFAQFWQNLGSAAVYYPRLAKVTGGVTASILYVALCQWRSRPSQAQKTSLTLSEGEIEQATGLTRQEQQWARKQLMARSLLQAELVEAQTNTWSYSLDFDALEQKFAQSQPTQEPNAPPDTAPHPVKSDPYFPPRRQPIAVPVAPDYRFAGPWESQAQFEAFQRALLDYFKQQGVTNPSGWAFKIIDSMTKGIVSPFWEEFIAGIPLGESQKIKQDWEVEPGVPYPAFEEERIQYYVHKGEPLEAAVAKARADLRDPIRGKDLWEGFLRKCDRLADEALKAKKMGVETPYLPAAFTQRSLVTKHSVMQKLESVVSQPSLAADQQAEPKTDSAHPPQLNPKGKNTPSVPSLETLQKLYQSKMTRTLVEKQIAEHPEWGYQIVDGQVVDRLPF